MLVWLSITKLQKEGVIDKVVIKELINIERAVKNKVGHVIIVF